MFDPKFKIVAAQERKGDKNEVKYDMDINSYFFVASNSILTLIYP